ncbi:MAG: hypothetical protein ACK5KR_08960 [Breznakia sp.]
MGYTPYVDKDVYKKYSDVITDEKQLEKSIRIASRHIDTLTYNRMVGKFDKLTDFQKELVQEVICGLIDFEYENHDLITSVLQSYSINGVSMSFGQSWNVSVQGGVAIPTELYSLLEQTGLCYRGLS